MTDTIATRKRVTEALTTNGWTRDTASSTGEIWTHPAEDGRAFPFMLALYRNAKGRLDTAYLHTPHGDRFTLATGGRGVGRAVVDYVEGVRWHVRRYAAPYPYGRPAEGGVTVCVSAAHAAEVFRRVNRDFGATIQRVAPKTGE